ncbi:MAG TPA: glycosyltransferase [Clostridia bacterium]|nr:glycosyltransferase [Clostridia bacterium]
MKITFFSNFFNDHQLSLCNALYRQLGQYFVFAATEPMSDERLQMGFEDIGRNYPYVEQLTGPDKFGRCLELASSSDVAIVGSAPKNIVQKRLKEGKLTFYYSERMFRKGLWQILKPRTFFELYRGIVSQNRQNLYVLCAGAYAAWDFNRLGVDRDHLFRWGYFPQTGSYDVGRLIESKTGPFDATLLWAGRLVPLKHPELAVKCLSYLKSGGWRVRLDFVGSGEMETPLKEMCRDLGLEDTVRFLGMMKPAGVRKAMENSDIFLFTSNKKEGWGAVLNEAMSCGCAVVASSAAGASKFLIQQGENGFLYPDGDQKGLFHKAELLTGNRLKRRQVGAAACRTITELWNADIASQRLIGLCDSLLAAKSVPFFERGPCSRAEILRNPSVI